MRKVSSASLLVVAVVLAGASVCGAGIMAQPTEKARTIVADTGAGTVPSDSQHRQGFTAVNVHPVSPEFDRQVSFDDGWKFHNGEVENAADPKTNDANWRSLNVPHDYAIEGVVGKDPSIMEGPFDPKSPAGAGGGSLNAGVAWYRKTFSVPASAKGKRIAIAFDGVYMNSDVYLNGILLGNHPYGYTPFQYDLTDELNFNGPNVIAVRCNVEQPSSRWYSGAGIYRDVYLVTTNPVHIAQWGTYITTEIKDNDAVVTVRTEIVNDLNSDVSVTVLPAIIDPSGKAIANDFETPIVKIPAHGQVESRQSFTISNAQLWSVDSPKLYKMNSSVMQNGAAVDQTTTTFGIRTIEFTKDNGFLLNGKRVQIQGVCDHHDLGCLGSAFNYRALQRQLELLKAMGCNAIRTSHNPPDTALLDLADSMGFLVMDEAFDEWKQSKTKFGYGRFFDQWSEPDLVTMIHRDRNHPSVILWSIGNEIKEQGPPKVVAAAAEGKIIAATQPYTLGGIMATRLADIAHREDPTRPVTSACNSAPNAVKSGFADALDVFGLNYYSKNYETQKGRVLLASETASALSTRGEYGLHLNAKGEVEINIRPPFQCTSYDLDKPNWGSTAETSILALRNAPWVAGEFVWTGFDYIGEPTPYKYPSRSSYFGIIDLAGFPKDRYYIYQSQWQTKPMVHLLPHWTWPGFEGKEIPVQAYTTGDSAELFLNGKSLGTRDFKDNKTLHLEWKVPYEPGTLKVVAKKDGKEIAEDYAWTAGKPAMLEIIPDRGAIQPDGKDLSFVTVRVVDKDHHLCPDADNEISFTVTGPAQIAGVDNGDPTNHESFQGTLVNQGTFNKAGTTTAKHKAFHGLALLVVRSQQQIGHAEIQVSADGVAGNTETLRLTPTAP